jgi:hypothetical protein
LLDDTKDADSDEHHTELEEKKKQAEFEQKADDISKMKIAPVKVNIMKQKCADDGVAEDKVLALYKITSFEEMTEKQFKNATDNWKKIVEM